MNFGTPHAVDLVLGSRESCESTRVLESFVRWWVDSLRLRQMTRVWSTGITNVVLSTIVTAHFIILRASVNGRRCRLTSPHGLLPPLRALVWPHFQHNSMPFQYFLER